MQRLFALSAIFFSLCLLHSTFAQRLVKVTLNETDPYLVKPLQVSLSPGDTLMFTTTKGDFAINILEASKFLEIEETDLKVEVNKSNPNSPKYLVKKISDIIDQPYSVFCITKRVWPLAPPRIIVAIE